MLGGNSAFVVVIHVMVRAIHRVALYGEKERREVGGGRGGMS